jgi:hypothetical protein
MLLPKEATQWQPSFLAKHHAKDNRRLRRVVHSRSVDQAYDMRGGDDDGDVDGGASRSMVTTMSRCRWTCKRRGATQVCVPDTLQTTPVAPSKKVRCQRVPARLLKSIAYWTRSPSKPESLGLVSTSVAQGLHSNICARARISSMYKRCDRNKPPSCD